MIFKRFINSLFPKNYTCVVCSRDIFNNTTGVCDKCKNLLPYLTGRLCLHCNEPLIADGDYCIYCKGKDFVCDRIYSPFKYEGKLKTFVRGLKYDNKKYYSEILAGLMAEYFIKCKIDIDFIIPVPLCEKRLKLRGYNQSELIASEFAKLLNLEVKTDILYRVKETPTQTNLNKFERKENMKNAFVCHNRRNLKGKTVLLIDDVYTTGATIDECATTLNKAGAKIVYGFTACHTLKQISQTPKTARL